MLYSVNIQQVFKVSDATLERNFAAKSKDIGNRQLLWHGSRLCNWAGILSTGLRIAPPEAIVSGCAFGEMGVGSDAVISLTHLSFSCHTTDMFGKGLYCTLPGQAVSHVPTSSHILPPY